MYTKFSKLPQLLLIFVLAFVSCHKEEDFGLGFIPESEQLNISVDTFNVEGYSFRPDSFLTSGQIYGLLGEYDDPIFGKSSASFISQIRLSEEKKDFGDSAVAKSLKLTLQFGGHYGDISKNLNVKIYRVTDDFNKSDSYYGYSINVENYTEELANFDITPQDSSETITIDLPIEFANKLINIPADSTMFNSLFVKYFKGLYFKVSETNTGNSIIYLNLSSTKSALTLTYDNKKEANQTFYYKLNSECARINIFKHDYTTTVFGNTIFNDDDTPTNKSYIQAMSGVRTILNIPNLDSLYALKNTAVLKAELILKVDETSITDNLSPCDLLTIRKKVGESTFVLADESYYGTNSFGGKYNKTNNSYTFNITTFVQDIYKGTSENSSLILMAGHNKINAQRTVLDLSSENTKLKVTYIKMK